MVEDEPLIYETVKEALEEGGFQVRPEHTAAGAMLALDECSAQLSGLITDVNVGFRSYEPGYRQACTRASSRSPIVYTSGYSSADWSALGVQHSTIVPKPYAPAQIVTAIWALINKRASQPGATST